MKRGVTSAVLSGAILLRASAASADLPPPDGTKFVGYELVVKGVPAGETALLAFPCSSSNGVPETDAKRLVDGTPVAVGRRGGNCKLYAAKAAEWEALAATKYEDRGSRTKALQAFFEKATPCSGASPTMASTLPKTDPRTVVRETLEVKELTPTACRLALGKTEATPSPAAASASAAPSSAAAATVPTSGGAPPARTGGCAAAPASSGSTSSALVTALAVLALRARRRRT